MKKILLTFALLIAVGSSLVAQKYDVRLNLQPGLKVPVRHQQVMDQTVEFQGQTMKTKQVQKNEIAFSVISKNGDNYVIEGIINLSEVSVESPQGNMTFSSADANDNAQNKELKSITGKVVRAEITPYFQLVGEVTPVTEGLSSDKAKGIYEAISSIFSGLYPTNSVAQGESWEAAFGGGVKGNSTLTAASAETYVIDSKLTMDMDMQGLPLSGKGTMNHEIHAPTGVPLFGLITLPLSGSTVSNGTPVNVKINITSSFEFIQ